MARWIVLLLLATLGLADDKVTFKDNRNEGTANIDERFGLLASQLGLPPVPGSGSSESSENGQPLPLRPPSGENRQPSGGCSCVPTQFCSPQQLTDGSGNIDIRKVSTPPVGVICSSGEVYCCPTPLPPKCGTRTRIQVPGVKLEPGQAEFGKYPWEALVLGENNNYIGGGVLLDSFHVLTTAHKVAPFPNGEGLKVRMGEWNAKENTEPFKYEEYGIQQSIIHPGFNANNLHNDVAVLKLSQPVRLGAYPHINTACIPPSNARFTGQRCWVSGWGKDAFGPAGNYQYIQKEIEVPILETSDCEVKLRGTRLGQYFQLDRKSFLCAGGEPGKDACTGDGGSPLVCEVNDQFYLVGMVAWGIGCADPGIPGVYVNVLNFMDWIQQQMRQ